MANPHKGEVTFEAGGKTHTLRLDTNAICILEDDLNLGITEIAALLQAGRLSIMRAAMRAGLVNGHAEGEALSLSQAGEIIDDLGYMRTAELLGRALERAFPSDTQGDQATRPRRAGVGTGARSS